MKRHHGRRNLRLRRRLCRAALLPLVSLLLLPLPAPAAPPGAHTIRAIVSNHPGRNEPAAWTGHFFGENIGGRYLISGPRRYALRRKADITYHGVTLSVIIGDRTARWVDGRWDIPRRVVLRVWGKDALTLGLLPSSVHVHRDEKARAR